MPGAVSNRNVQMAHGRSAACIVGLAQGARVLVAATALAFIPGTSRAACNFTSGQFTAITFTAPATFSVPRDLPNGSTIVRLRAAVPRHSVRCNGDPVGTVNSVGPTPALNQVLMPIGSTGLSWRWAFRFREVFEASYGSRTLNGTESFTRGENVIDLIKTGVIPGGAVVPAGELGRYRYGSLDAMSARLGNAIAVATQSCSTSDIGVSLGARRSSDFSGIGSSSSHVAFSIGLECPGGLSRIRFRVDPAAGAVVDSSRSLVPLDAGSSARGVAVQLLNGAGTAPLPLAAFQPFAGYTGAAGTYSIPLRARYYQTAATVTGVSANSAVTFTLSYE